MEIHVSQDHAANDPIANASRATDNINQIRDILFGEKMRTVERRFEELEQRLSDQQSFQAQLSEQVQRLQVSIEQAVSVFDEKLTEERRVRDQLGNEIFVEINRLDNEQRTRANQIETDLTDKIAVLKRELKDQIDAVEVRVNTEQARLAENLSSRSKALQESKIDGEDLSNLLSELARRLVTRKQST